MALDHTGCLPAFVSVTNAKDGGHQGGAAAASAPSVVAAGWAMPAPAAAHRLRLPHDELRALRETIADISKSRWQVELRQH